MAADLGARPQEKAASADTPEERLSAERLLANLRVQTSFYVPENFLAKNDAPHALLALSIAAEIDPDEPHVYYNLACAAARTGQTSRMFKELDRAVAKGFRRFEMIDSDPTSSRYEPIPRSRSGSPRPARGLRRARSASLARYTISWRPAEVEPCSPGS